MMKHHQKGFLSLIAIILIAVVAVIAVTTTQLFINNTRSTSNTHQSTQALFLSEAGTQRGIRQWNLDNLYTAEGPVSFGAGTFTVSTFDTDFTGAPLSGTQKRIRGTGTVATATRVTETIVQRNPSELITNPDFDNPGGGSPPSDWTLTLSNWPGPAYGNSGVGGTPAITVEKNGTSGTANTTASQSITPIVTPTASTDFIVNFQYHIPTYTGGGSLKITFILTDTAAKDYKVTKTYSATTPGFQADTATINVNKQGVTLDTFTVELDAAGGGPPPPKNASGLMIYP